MGKKNVRRYPRVLTTFPVQCKLGDETFRSHASALGGSGLFLRDPRVLPEGAEITMRFRPARHLPTIQVQARIRYSIPAKGSGVEFTQISPEHHEMILRLIHHKTGDRRRFPRVTLATQIYSKDDMTLAFSRDVGLGGMFIETRQPNPVGSEIDLRFHLDDGGPVMIATAEVIYTVAKLGMGVGFTEMSTGDRERLEAFVARLAAPARSGAQN